MASLAVLGLALTLVAQVSLAVLRERRRAADLQAAQELAANVLESARARGWDELTGTWASRQRLPEEYTERGWRLEVRVEPEKSRPLVRRVTVVVRWQSGEARAPLPVELVGLFSARAAGAPKGGKP
jgi:hypothetical protein